MRGEDVRVAAQDPEHWDSVALTVRVLTPALTLLRLVDGKTGASLGKVYAAFVKLDEYYRGSIEGMDATTSERMHQVFMARWTYFHEPIFTCVCVTCACVCVCDMCVPILGAYFLDNEFIKDEHSPKVSMSSRLVSLTLTLPKDALWHPSCGRRHLCTLGRP